MKALTVCQPWAWLIVNGHKRIENRSWRPGDRYRGPLIIHAGKSCGWAGACSDPDLLALVPGLPAAEEHVYGAIVGIVDVVDYLRAEDGRVVHDPFAGGPWCWMLENPRAFAEPVPYRGERGIFEIADCGLPIADCADKRD